MAEAELKFENEKVSGIAVVGSYLFDAAQRLGIEVSAECERRGECETCAMNVTQGREFLSAPTTAEIKQLGDTRLEAGERLSCQAKIEEAGEISIMITQKNEENKPETEEEKTKQYRKEFEEMPLEKKIASLVELEAIALSDTFSFILNSPYQIVGKIMDVMAEFGLKLEDRDKEAKRPKEHQNGDQEADGEDSSAKTVNKKKGAGKKSTVKAETGKEENGGDNSV